MLKLREHHAENEEVVNKEKEEQVDVKEETEEWVEEPGKRPDQADPQNCPSAGPRIC